MIVSLPSRKQLVIGAGAAAAAAVGIIEAPLAIAIGAAPLVYNALMSIPDKPTQIDRTAASKVAGPRRRRAAAGEGAKRATPAPRPRQRKKSSAE